MIKIFTGCLLLAVIISQSGLASDHIDGVPSLELHQQVDLTDLYAFETPGRPGFLSIILNLYPGVGDHGHFSGKVGYEVLIRPAGALPRWAAGFGTDAASQAVIRCRFQDPGHHGSDQDSPGSVTCSIGKVDDTETFARVSGEVGKILSDDKERFRLFTGPKSDAFFMGLEQFESVTEREGFVPVAPGTVENLLERINVLSIVLELDLQALYPLLTRKVVAIAAQSHVVVAGQRQIPDRIGRPEITNLMLHSFGDSEGIKSSYNRQPAFTGPGKSDVEKFRSRIIENVGEYDLLDGIRDWQPAELEGLAALFLEDYLIIDLDRPCPPDTNGYLALEKARLLGEEPASCGGRRLNDDIMNTLYALCVGGPRAPLSDFGTGVDAPYRSSNKHLSNRFPYLADPEPTGFFDMNLKRFFLNHVIKRRQD